MSHLKNDDAGHRATKAGGFSAIGGSIVIVGELLCEAVDLRAGQKVLDVATGSGNTALAAARRWCQVTAIDWVPALLDRGRERAESERLEIDFREGEPEDIPFPDGSFDVVLSTFGCMFAPNQEKAARELLRVCRRGGKIGLTNWTPAGLTGQLFDVTARHVPPPKGLCSPSLWGTEERVRELFGYGVSSFKVERRNYVYRYRSARHCLDFIRASFGPLQKAFETLPAAARAKLAAEVEEIVRRFNRSGDETIAAPSEYLEVVMQRSGK